MQEKCGEGEIDIQMLRWAGDFMVWLWSDDAAAGATSALPACICPHTRDTPQKTLEPLFLPSVPRPCDNLAETPAKAHSTARRCTGSTHPALASQANERRSGLC